MTVERQNAITKDAADWGCAPAGKAEDAVPASWRDGKRYAWLLGLLVPSLPFLAWGLVHATGLAVFGSSGRWSSSRCSP